MILPVAPVVRSYGLLPHAQPAALSLSQTRGKKQTNENPVHLLNNITDLYFNTDNA